MTTEPSNSRFFHAPRESDLAEDDTRSRVRAEFFDLRTRFLDRLACAEVFDSELFEALLLSLDALSRCCSAADMPMPRSDFSQFDIIANHLELQATHSRNQRAECATARSRWLALMRQHHLLPETQP